MRPWPSRDMLYSETVMQFDGRLVEGSAGVPLVSLKSVKPGAVLEQPVHSPRGLLLAPAGAVLTEAYLSTFASWGVLTVSITGKEALPQEEHELDEEQLRAVHDLIEDRFSLVVPMYPFMREVQRVSEQIVIKRLQTRT